MLLIKLLNIKVKVKSQDRNLKVKNIRKWFLGEILKEQNQVLFFILNN